MKDSPKPPDRPLRVWLIEDNEDYRNSVSKIVRKLAGPDGVLAFRDCEEALKEGQTGTAPHVILLDISLPGMSGIEGIGRLKALGTDTSVVMLTSVDNHERVFEAICAGASGYLLKSAPINDILAAIQEVLAGGAPMTPKIARAVLNQFVRVSPPKTNVASLSSRETEVLEAMARGRTLKEIADELAISRHTADTYIRRIYEKLHVNTRSGAVAKGFKGRWI